MKVATAANALIRFADALESFDASADLTSLRAFISALEPANTLSIGGFAKSISGLRFNVSHDLPRLGELSFLLEAHLQLLEEVARPDILAGLKLFLAIVREHGDISIVGFALAIRKHLVPASKGQSRKGAAQMDRSLVDDYLRRLEAALGDDSTFRALFRELDADKRVTKIEAIELATRFLGPTPLSTSRPKALQRVLHRHQKLVDFKRSSESIRRGRSAA